MKKVLLVGSGGREHALAWKIAQSPLLEKLYVAPGNVGMENIAERVDIAADDIESLLRFAKEKSIDLTVVGPEAPLVLGLTDAFEAEGLKVFGPSQEASQLEGSKAFSKEAMTRFGIPTAHYEIFSNVKEAKHYILEAEMPIVIKADGLAAGKGVLMCETAEEAMAAIKQVMEDKAFGDAGSKVVIEEMLQGEEISIFTLTDGEKMIPLVSARDHKRAFDHDQGPNTGGMGAYSPNPLYSEEELKSFMDQCVKPMVAGLSKEGSPYRGVLYTGVMVTKDGPYVLEYNCRFGDPEAQVILPRMKTDILPIMFEISGGKLKSSEVDWDERPSMTVVLASGGYPGSYKKGIEIQGLQSTEEIEDVTVFHAGTDKNDDGKVVTSGGRVLAVTALGEDLRSARDQAYDVISKISIEGAFYRRDIGSKISEHSATGTE